MIVIQRNGTLDLNSIMPLRKVVRAEHKQTLLSEDVLNIKVESKEPLDLFIGDKLEYSGRFFYLNFMPKVNKEQGIYSYDLTFEGVQYSLRKKIYFNLDKTGFQTSSDFPLTGEIDIFLKVLIDNINKVETGWILGEFPRNTETKTITFSDENCLAVLQKICKEYDTEFEIKEDVTAGTKTLNIKKIGETKSFVFEYGMGNGLYSIHRDNISQDVVTRLYVYGASDNIPSNYRDYSGKLRMPVANGDYLQDDEKVNLFGIKEAVKVFENIKPTFKGVVSSVGGFDKINGVQEIYVENMDFDLNEKDTEGNTKYLIAGTPAKLHFNKGNLAGYSFELQNLIGYNHDTKCFRVKQFTDERGQKFPDNDTIFKFEVGDEFTILDIVMPESYIERAEQKLLEAGQNEYLKQSQNNTKYSIVIDPMFLAQKGSESTVFFGIGDYIRIVDEPLKIDKTSRIISLTRDLLDLYHHTLEIADTYEISFTASVLNDIMDTKKIVKTQKQVIRENFKNGYKNLAELKDAIFDTEGYFDTENIKPHSIETNMLSVGTKNQQFVLENVTLDPNKNGNPANVSITGGKLVHFTISNDIKEWELLPIEQQGLLDIVYYIYAKVERDGTGGSWHITTDKIKFDELPNYYHFLCYVLYTPKNGKREAEAMYGNTLIHGGQVTTGRIKSTNGQTYFDLDSGEIRGRITFTSNSTALKQIKKELNMVKNLLKEPLHLSGSDFAGSDNAQVGIITINNPEWNAYSFLKLDQEKTNQVLSMALMVKADTGVKFNVAFYSDFADNGKRTETITGNGEWQWLKIEDVASNVSDSKSMLLFTGVKGGELGKIEYKDLVVVFDSEAPNSYPYTTDELKNIVNGNNETIKSLLKKTDFLKNTTIEGNVIATGNVILGNELGANAGITGIGSDKDIFLWGGAGFDNRENAPINITREGKLVMRHSNGNIGFEIGINNGALTLNGYHEEGFKLFEIDPNRGFVNIGYTMESWKEMKVVYLGESKDIKSFVTIQVDRSGGGYDDPLVVDCTAYLHPNKTIYDYNNGNRPDNEKYIKYVGYKTETQKRENEFNVPNGWYIFETGLLGDWSRHPNKEKITVRRLLYYIKNGVITKTEWASAELS